MQQQKLLDFVSMVYEGVSNPAALGAFLEGIVDYFGADAGDISFENCQDRSLGCFSSLGYDDRFRDVYASDYLCGNVWRDTTRRCHVQGIAISGNGVFSDGTLLSSRFYNEWLRPQGNLRFSMAAILENDSRSLTTLGLVRSRTSGPYGSRDASRLKPLAPHVRRSVQLSRRVRELERNFKTILLTLERCYLPVIVLGPQGKVLEINERADHLIAEGRGLLLDADRRIACEHYSDTRSLEMAINQCTPCGTVGPEKSEAFCVIRPFHGNPLGVLVTRLSYGSPGFEDTSWRTTLIIIDPQQSLEVQEGWLRQMFNLTPTEVRLAACFLSGATLEEFADESNVAIGTVRWHLKNLLEKTGAKRQADLVRILMNALRFSGAPGGYE